MYRYLSESARLSMAGSRAHLLRRFASLFSRWSLAAFAFTAAATLVSFTSTAQAQVVSNNFEDGTTQGWSPRGPVTLTASSDVAHGGTLSLKTTGRTAGWNGPSLDLRSHVAVNATYQVTGWVRLVAGFPASNLKFTLERTSNGTTSYSQVNAAVSVTDSAWVQLQGTFTLPSDANTALNLYLESSDVTSAYYLDDFTITALTSPKCPEPLDQSGILTDFENGAAQGWVSRGSAVLTNVTTAAEGGTHSLAVTGRTASWQGAGINALCKLHKGFKYNISVWVRLLPGEAPSDLRVSLQSGLAGVTTYSTVIGNKTVTDAAWVNLSTQYTFAMDVDQLQLYIESASGTSSFYIDEFALVNVPIKPIQTDIPSLRDVLSSYFPIGTAIEPDALTGVHADLLLKHFNQFTAGNSMKWDATEPSDGVFNFARADALANFARAHGLRMRGHTMVWHSQTPAWVFQDANGQPLQPGNPDHRALLLSRMERHIHTVISRYADIVDSWDVVNEVIDPSQPDGLRASPWRQIIGPEFIDWAFEYAREAAPNALLYINDYSTTDAAKRSALQKVVQGLLSRGVPVDGVGHQMHINNQYPPIGDIRSTIELFSSMGLENEITEMDVSAYTNSTDTSPVSPQTLVEQGYRYRDIFNLYRELSSKIHSVTLWGLADDGTWLKTFPITRDDKPLLFDEELQAKPAYWGVVDPTKLPIVPKSLNVTRVSNWIVGQLQPFWNSLAPQPLTSVSQDASWAQFRAVWKGDKVYVYAEVSDKTRTLTDAVDIYIGAAHYRFRNIGLQRPNGAEALALPSSSGYVLFAAIPAGQNLAVGNTLKFDIRATDASNGNQVSWSDTKNGQDADLSNLGTLTMIPERQVSRAIRGTPTIDGVADKAWKNADEVTTKLFVLGTSGATAKVRTMWDDGHIYVYAQVTDPNLSKASPNVWEQDSVELFIDSNNAQTTTYQSDDAQYRVNFDNEQSFGGAAAAGKIVSATRKVAGGYIVEAAIAVDDLPEVSRRLGDGAFIGFDVQVNDDGAGNGVRSSVATWNDTAGNNYKDTSRFGAIQLVPQGR
ncbi:MAG TPA: endo-1,4-beta-xylanase [Opitutaceae bacterium]|nr:endo-1,4-beta-xylanase [Opitutaceae bacterium]